MRSTSFLLLFASLLFPLTGILQAQELSHRERAEQYREVPDDAYLPNAFGNKKTSPAYKSRSVFHFTTQANVNENGENILGDAANEPSIGVNPVDPQQMVIGWRQFDNVNSNFRQAGYAYTTDGGQSWTFPGVIEPGVFRSDPVLEGDLNGTLFYNSLTAQGDDYWCNVYRSDEGGANWDMGVYAQGGDKQWMEIDKTDGPGSGNIYAFWTSYFSICSPRHFTRSVDGGDSYQNCVTIAGNPYWGTLAIGPESELYMVGSGNFSSLVVVKSTTAANSGSNVTWDFTTNVDLDGDMTSGTMVNPGGLLGQASIATDVSDGPGQGNVYVLASVQRNSVNDPADVMFAKSTDGGQTFEAPKRINTDFSMSNYQWFGTMSVAPNGRIDVIWLDTRDAPSNMPRMSSLYYAFSTTQGDTWSENIRLSDAFDPHVGWPNQQKMGDYYDLVSDDNGANLAWANTLNGEQDVYFTRIDVDITSLNAMAQQEIMPLLQANPNPAQGQTTIALNLLEKSVVRLSVTDSYGRLIQTVLHQELQEGAQQISLSLEGYKPGIYLLVAETNQQKKTTRLVVY